MKHKDSKKPFKWKQFKGNIILWLVSWYCRYALSYGDLKAIAAERNLSVERSTICAWVNEYARELRLKPHLKKTSDSWKLDETYIKIKGKWHYLYRAIDKYGQTLDWMLRCYRIKTSAKRFFKKVLANQHVVSPRVITVDKSPTFPPTLSELQEEGKLPRNTQLKPIKYLNSPMENDHKFTKCTSRYRQWHQSFETAKRAITGMDLIRLIQKGQLKYATKGDVRAQNDIINKLFNLAA